MSLVHLVVTPCSNVPIGRNSVEAAGYIEVVAQSGKSGRRLGLCDVAFRQDQESNVRSKSGRTEEDKGKVTSTKQSYQESCQWTALQSETELEDGGRDTTNAIQWWLMGPWGGWGWL